MVTSEPPRLKRQSETILTLCTSRGSLSKVCNQIGADMWYGCHKEIWEV